MTFYVSELFLNSLSEAKTSLLKWQENYLFEVTNQLLLKWHIFSLFLFDHDSYQIVEENFVCEIILHFNDLTALV